MATLRQREATLRALLAPELTHYEVLRIAPADAEQSLMLARARRTMAALAHPDRWSADMTPARAQLTQDVMARINVAYDALSDAKSRAVYVKTLKNRTPCPFCSGTGVLRVRKSFTSAQTVSCARCSFGYK